MLATTINLAARVKRPSRKPIVLPKLALTQAQAADLATIYLRIVAQWSAAHDKLVAAYSAALSSLVTDSADGAGSTLEGIASEIQRLVALLTPDLRNWALRVETVHRGKWISNVLSATSVDLSTVLSPYDVGETVDTSVSWNASLVRDVSEETRRRIANAIFTGLQQRAPADDVAKQITEATGMARYRSRRIAGDQTVKLGARLNQARQEQAGITSFKWRHSAKRHPRSWHVHRDGKVYPWRGNSIPADDMPGVPPFCGCTAQGVVTFD